MMPNPCADLHAIARSGTIYSFPFEKSRIPANGIYVLFEGGEEAHDGARIVRVGTHTGDGQLLSRLLQHFVKENKDRSIFRKNIGRALLNRAEDSFLAEWNMDRTSRAAKKQSVQSLDTIKCRAIESEVTKYLQANLKFVLFQVETKEDRLQLESRMISTVSLCQHCRPSKSWLGFSSPKQKIQQSGLWLVNELYKESLSGADLKELARCLI
jgi:hypothetical protein